MPRIVGAVIYASIKGSLHLVALGLILVWATERRRWGWEEIVICCFAVSVGIYLGAQALYYAWDEDRRDQEDRQQLHRQRPAEAAMRSEERN